MVLSQELKTIRTLLEQSASPFFLYDNDADGLCSFVLLRRFLGRGEGSAVRSNPDIDVRYAHQALAHGADLVVVLDRPYLGDSFLRELESRNIPVLWIDHHQVDSSHREHSLVHAFNPCFAANPSHEPVTHWSYLISSRAEDCWIAVMGCIADHFLPPYVSLVKKTYPELWASVKKPFEAYYTTELGFLARMIAFGLKSPPSQVSVFERSLYSCSSPHDFKAALDSSEPFAEEIRSLAHRYKTLIERACAEVNGQFIFFTYGGETSMSSEIANELSFRYPSSYVLVTHTKPGILALSLRGNNVLSFIEQVLPLFPRASGGGHRDAVGVRLPSSELNSFKHELFNLISASSRNS